MLKLNRTVSTTQIHQKQLRIDSYRGLADHLSSDATTWATYYSAVFLSRRASRYASVLPGRYGDRRKNLYKYVCKGPDRASLRLLQENVSGQLNEILANLDARYVCAPEAIHHIFKYECQFKSDTVYRLQVHLPDYQFVAFLAGQEQEALSAAAHRDTILTAWFKLNLEYEQGEQDGVDLQGGIDPRSLYYYQIPEFFTFVQETRKWKIRERGTRQIGRMYTATPRDMERFSLRLLLLHRKNIHSSEDLRTIEGVVHTTFTEAARAFNLLHDDAHYGECLAEAAQFQMPFELRALFGYMLAFCDISDPQLLYDRIKTSMAEYFINRGYSPLDAESLVYYDLSNRLAILQYNLSERITPPTPHRPELEAIQDDWEYHSNKGTELYNCLNSQQRTAADSILASFETGRQKMHYIDGPGGSGKTYLYNTIYHILKGRHKSIICVAWTGIAASLLPEGRTASSTFKLSMGSGNRECVLKREHRDAIPLKQADAIVWDEISMRGREGYMVDVCIKNSRLWRDFETHNLFVNMKAASSGSSWCELLMAIGNGEIEQDSERRIHLPSDLMSNGNLIDEVFGDELTNTDNLSDYAILAPRNFDANRINEEAIDRLSGPLHEYKSIDDVVGENQNESTTYISEFLNSLSPAGLPPHKLSLKKGAIVILLRNLDVRNGLCNGTRLIATHFRRFVLSCSIASGEREGQFVLIPRIDNYTDKGVPFRLRRRQFPIRVAFAMTINKAQGQSLMGVGVHLGSEVFSHGQLYVALSRAKRRERVKVYSPGAHVKNIVIKDVLR
ncbi:hypothetical protein ANCCAN_16484 [Ancylostoma caninum]|uniref:ATP-dependent DNA helicase n=1 Tax=Ancylostoma caninum TaxID=29170 RepID=A0A368FZI6_ANCCA|nr:hypothetical protein ANCCAN_16484 [Ancylostoma caninum]